MYLQSVCIFPQSHGLWRDAHSDCRQQAWSAARSRHPQTQRIWLSPKKLEVWICGVLCQVQLAHFTIVRRGSPQRGLCPLQARPCHHPFSAGTQERAMRPYVRLPFLFYRAHSKAVYGYGHSVIARAAGRAVITLMPRNLTFGILTTDRQMWFWNRSSLLLHYLSLQTDVSAFGLEEHNQHLCLLS